uniref:DNA-directed RNA polymerase n=1 Tax=Strongyloides venezuelensis TaxID=75913 RepID=A0A0K0FZF0_STRVS
MSVQGLLEIVGAKYLDNYKLPSIDHLGNKLLLPFEGSVLSSISRFSKSLEGIVLRIHLFKLRFFTVRINLLFLNLGLNSLKSDLLNVNVNDINILKLETHIAKSLKVNLYIYDNGFLYNLLNCISNDYSRNCLYFMIILQKSNNYFQIVSKVFPSSSTNSLNFLRFNSIEEGLFFSFVLKALQNNVQVNVSELEIELDKINFKKGYKAVKNNLQKLMVLIERDEDTSKRYEEFKNKISVTTVE